MSNPERSEKLHRWQARFWLLNLATATYLYFFKRATWDEIAVFYLVVVSLENNITNHYGAAKSAQAARVAEDNMFKKAWKKVIRR